MSPPRVMIWAQHLLGIGHLKRAAALARGFAEAGLETILVSGGLPVTGLALGGARLIQLPPLKTVGDGRWALLDRGGAPVDEAWLARRRDRLLDIFRALRPAALVLEMYPFGRRQFAFELEPLLDAATAVQPRPLVLCSVRDVLQRNDKPGRAETIAELVARRFDHVLVHGDPAVLPFDASFAQAARIADRLSHTGFVRASTDGGAAPAARRGVVVSAGGGAVGTALLQTALAARPLSALADAPWQLLTGPNLPEAAFDALVKAGKAAGAGLTVARARDDFPRLLATAAVSVSQGGYNTITDLIAARVAAVVVPFARGGESEQTMRATRLAEMGLLRVLAEDGLTPARLAAAIDAAAAAGPMDASDLDLSGVETSARLLSGWLAERRARLGAVE